MIGFGVDIVDVERVRYSLEKWGKRWESRIFTEGEISYCRSAADPAQSYAARFAAKEAFFKAHPSPPDVFCPKMIEVSIDTSGRPEIFLSGLMKGSVDSIGQYSIFVTLTHISSMAAAVVVIEKGTK